MKFDLLYTDLKRLDNFEYIRWEDYGAHIFTFQDIFEESGNVTFTLTCLGEDWDMIIYDFSLFTEHLLDIYQLCDKEVNDSYLMWYVEQGINREILFTKTDNDTIKIENHPRTYPSYEEEWKSPLPYEYISIPDLKAQCVNFVGKIKDAMEILYPEFNNEVMVKEWYKEFKL